MHFDRPRFSSRWWKLILWLGSILVICGFFLLILAFILPRKNTNVNASNTSNPSSVIFMDPQALAYNDHLETSRSIGLFLVVFGGILFTLSLLIPTFCHTWCATGDTNDETDPLKVTQSRFSRLSKRALFFLVPNGGVSERTSSPCRKPDQNDSAQLSSESIENDHGWNCSSTDTLILSCSSHSVN